MSGSRNTHKSSKLANKPSHQPPLLFSSDARLLISSFSVAAFASATRRFRALPSHAWWNTIITHSLHSPLDPSLRPTFLHLHPRALFLPVALKCSSESRCSDNCSRMTDYFFFFPTLIHRPVVMEIGLSKWRHSSLLTNDKFEFSCVCGAWQIFALHHPVIPAKSRR